METVDISSEDHSQQSSPGIGPRGQGTSGRRAASETSSGTSSSSRETSVRDTLMKRRNVQERQGDVMERHRHWSVSGVAGSGAQKAGAREAAQRYQSEPGAFDQYEERDDIRARLARQQEVIFAETVANRPQRRRQQVEMYQAETSRRDRKGGEGRTSRKQQE